MGKRALRCVKHATARWIWPSDLEGRCSEEARKGSRFQIPERSRLKDRFMRPDVKAFETWWSPKPQKAQLTRAHVGQDHSSIAAGVNSNFASKRHRSAVCVPSVDVG